MKTANLLMKDNFYAGHSNWQVISDNDTVCLKPVFNRKSIILQTSSIIFLSLFSYIGVELIYHYRLVTPSSNIQSELFHLIPYSLLIFGLFAIITTNSLTSRDIRRGPTFIYNRNQNVIRIPYVNVTITPDESTFLQYIHDSKGDSVYELNLLHGKKRFPLLRALNPFVQRIGEELSEKTKLKYESYQSNGKRPFYQVATGGCS